MSKPKQSAKGSKAKAPTYRIVPDSTWANAWKIAAVFGAVGSAACLLGMSNDPHRFAFSWLFAFMTFLAMGLGGLFFTVALHLTGAGWGITVRRTSEMLMIGLWVFPLLFIPIGFHVGELYDWTHHESAEEGEHGEGHEDAHEGEHEHAHEEGDEHGSLIDALGPSVARGQDVPQAHDYHPNAELPGAAAEGHAAAGEGAEAHHDPEHAIHHEVIESKLGYLDLTFFFIRACIYFLAWMLLSFIYFRWSTRQDKEKGLELTKKMQRFAPLSTFAFGFSLTFAAVDWMMSLEPSWFSTIFGVQYFAVSSVVALSAVILLTMGLKRAGVLGDAVNIEHWHDVGKLLHGFIIFWAYISFSQFILIWYAGIPEEATYYHLRWWGGGGFQNLSILLMVAHFVVPFFLLLSRNAKRNPAVLAFGCAWMLVMHVAEMYWLVMPYAEQTGLVTTHLRVHWMDVAALIGVGGTYMAVVLFQMTRYPMIPIGDPRLSRALHFQNA